MQAAIAWLTLVANSPRQTALAKLLVLLMLKGFISPIFNHSIHGYHSELMPCGPCHAVHAMRSDETAWLLDRIAIGFLAHGSATNDCRIPATDNAR